MKNTIEQEQSKELVALRTIIKPGFLEAVIILHPQNHIKIYELVWIADEHQLLQQLLTPQVLTPLAVNSCDINDFKTILHCAYFSNTPPPQTLLNQIFDIEIFKSAIINHLTDTTIMQYLGVITRDYPTIINKLPIAAILSSANIDLLSNTFIALLKSSDNSEIVLNYCNFNNPAHKEAFEAMMLSSRIPETTRTELLRIVLESGEEQFSYIDAPHISCNKERFLPIIQKVIDNIYTKLNPQAHQKLADNINIGLMKFHGKNLLITDIIK
ncbi:hypothetical protein [Candidatus Trichorickettsia mobilis]|uniref:hypothetical protein n=1 Tax=Candidatus Trichorickettsia mobilis TaxID=1346319 RepID=UPI00292D1BC6|nr:hypothetical protein [Candidatus Trichorickettsia mobilis]